MRNLCQSVCQYHRALGTAAGLLLRSTQIKAHCCPLQLQPYLRHFKTSVNGRKEAGGPKADEDENSTALMTARDLFEKLRTKDKETFNTAVELFHGKDKHARGHVEFIYSALRHMRTFGVHRDLESYKRIIDIFPKGRFIPSNMWQVEFMHFPKQQQCAIDVLDQMEDMGVMPDQELSTMLVNVFGTQGHPVRKLMRMTYWMPKFKNLSPWPLPDPMPEDAFELAKLAIKRITSVDLQTKITCFNAMDLDDSIDPTWIVSGQSPEQQSLIESHPKDKPVYVEGAFRVWMQRVCINYFILRAAPLPVPEPRKKDRDDVGILASMFQENYVESELTIDPSVHAQEDGVILAICATGTSSRDSILSWIRFLEQTNPRLGSDISVLFTLKSPLGATDDLEIGPAPSEKEPERISSFDGHPEQPEKAQTAEAFLGLDPSNPQLSQVGVDKLSDSRFPNWPHHFNKTSAAQREALASRKSKSLSYEETSHSASQDEETKK